MNQLVFLRSTSDEPYTTSDVIASHAGVQHHTVTRLIQQHESDFEEFGLLRANIEAVKREGARGVKYTKSYHLNEQQAALLMTYLKNTPQVRRFKKELVRQFFAMREELMKRRAQKEIRRPVRLNLTDTIKALPDSPHKHFKYKQYTDLAYKMAIGKTAKQIRAERGANKKDTASDFLTGKELEAVSKMENRISVMIELGMTYSEIKDKLNNCIIP